MFDIEKYIEQRWSKFYETLDRIKSELHELERLRSQTPTECLPPQAKLAANTREPARNLPHAHAVRRDQFQTKMSVGFWKTLKGYRPWFKIDHQQFFLQEVDTKKEARFYKEMLRIGLKRLKTNKSDG